MHPQCAVLKRIALLTTMLKQCFCVTGVFFAKITAKYLWYAELVCVSQAKSLQTKVHGKSPSIVTKRKFSCKQSTLCEHFALVW